MKTTPWWERISENREMFLSTKARHTFSGYAVSQLHRIKQHREWLLNPVERQPLRSDYGLPEDKSLVTKDQLNAFNELSVNYSNDVANTIIDTNFLEVLKREKAFQNANKHWNEYETWKKQRNPARAETERKYGYDTKHASHLVRLITEGAELLTEGVITFPRPDRMHLLEIRQGAYSYDDLMKIVGDVDSIFGALEHEFVLPRSPDREKADDMCRNITKEYLGFTHYHCPPPAYPMKLQDYFKKVSEGESK